MNRLAFAVLGLTLSCSEDTRTVYARPVDSGHNEGTVEAGGAGGYAGTPSSAGSAGTVAAGGASGTGGSTITGGTSGGAGFDADAGEDAADGSLPQEDAPGDAAEECPDYCHGPIGLGNCCWMNFCPIVINEAGAYGDPCCVTACECGGNFHFGNGCERTRP